MHPKLLSTTTFLMRSFVKKMINFTNLCVEIQHVWRDQWVRLGCLYNSMRFVFFRFHRFVLLQTNSFLLELVYFISISSLGFLVLKSLKPRTDGSFNPRILDLFYTSVSAATVSSMSVVEMEVFSDAQLAVLMVLMFAGGEVFTSLVGLHLKKRRLRLRLETQDKVASIESDLSVRPKRLADVVDGIELGLAQSPDPDDTDFMRYVSLKFLGSAILVYLVVVQVLGVSMVAIYFRVVSGAANVLQNKGINALTFSIFTTVSTFAGCGFVPTNENMMVFSKNSALLLILISQSLLGNTMFPTCLRLCLSVFDKFTNKVETTHLLRKTSEVRYLHLLPKLHCQLLVATVFGFIGVQFVMFSAMQWNSQALDGLNLYEKVVGVLFQCVNSRHTGENIVDLSTLAPAVLVLFGIMMYLPPYTSFLPVKDDDEERAQDAERRKPKIRGKTIENLIFSQLSYLAIFIIIICITERKKMKEDPLNFNVFSIVVEVISAYRNVGYSTGYSCERQLKPEAGCTDKWFGFSGRWSDEGKIILIIVMIFGRLMKFNMNGGRGWKLL